MHCLLLLPFLLTADPAPDHAKLLKTFREEFVAITPGEGKFPASFEMGRAEGGVTERIVHKVTFKHKFSIAKYEVPQNLWEEVVGQNPSRWKGRRNSVEMLNFKEAEKFCQKATELMRAAKLIDAKQTIRLPSEAEWEYCARAGTTTAYSFGDDEKEFGKYGWFTGNAAGNDPPVGAKEANAWGLYDMHGYLSEWCADTWHPDYKDAPTDGRAWITDNDEAKASRVLRSGSWKDPVERCTSSFRSAGKSDLRDDAVGLRCVLE